MLRLSSLVFLLFSAFQLSLAQDGLPQILKQLPASNERTLNRLMVQLSDLGPDVIESLANALKDASLREDLAERYAISAMAKYLGGQDHADYQEIEKAYIEAINQQASLELKVFLLEQFQFFATERSLPGLRNMIRVLCDPAITVISQIGGKAALQTLLNSYEEAGDFCKQTLAKAIADFDDPTALNQLEKIATSREIVPRSQVLPLLAAKGSPSSLPLLQEYAASNPELGNALLLDHAAVGAKRGDPTALNALAAKFLKSGDQGPLMQKAIKLVVQHGGATGKKWLLKTFKKERPAIAGMIATSLGDQPGLPLGALFKRIDKVGPTAQIGLLQQASKENFLAAVPVAKNLMKSPDVQVQKSAIKAISNLSKRKSLVDLSQLLKSSDNAAVLQTITSEMGRWVDTSNLDMVSALMSQTSGPAKASLIDMVAARGASTLFPEIKESIGSSEPTVRKSAFMALPKLAATQSLDQLVTIAPKVQSDEERSALVQALANHVQLSPDREQSTAELVRLVGGAPQIIQAVLPKIGGKTAMKTVNEKYATQPGEYERILQKWETPDALGLLIARARDRTPSAEELASILRLAAHPQLPADQKLLHLRELMPLLTRVEDQNRVLRSMGNIRTQTAFDYVSQYLSDSTLRQTAASTLVGIALPPAGEKYGLIGTQVKQQLMRADTILMGTDQDYTRAFLHNYLSSLPQDEGYVKIFNGSDLTGWKGLVGNPISRDTMFGLERQTKEREVARTLADRWKAKDGILKYVGDGYDNLCTVKKYRDFELVLDWRIEKDADSGLYLRGTPQVQIWDVQGSGEKNHVGSGGLFNNQVHESAPLTVADNPAGEWNTFRITMIDDKVTVYLNGVLVTDQVVLENYWNRELPIFREEQIELQAHTTVVEFRDIYIREIPGAPELTAMEKRQGFKFLFNGINLDGWVGNKVDYVAENGEIVIYPGAGGQGNLFTEQEYDNFRLRFEFKLTPGANNGLGIHAPLEGDAAYVGKELQILDNTAEKYANLKPYQYHGSVYGIAAAKRGELKPVGEWNTQEVVMKNNRVSVVLNNQRILSADLNIIARDGTLDGKEHPGLQRTQGHIGFLGHGDEVHFRNIRILEIEDEEGDN